MPFQKVMTHKVLMKLNNSGEDDDIEESIIDEGEGMSDDDCGFMVNDNF